MCESRSNFKLPGKIAITGVTGFVGSYLYKSLIEAGVNVIPISRSESEDLENLRTTDYSCESLISILQGVDSIVHLAARTMQSNDDINNIDTFYKSNVLLLKNIIDSCNVCSVKQVIYSSSRSVYSNANVSPYSEIQIPLPDNAYGLSKLFGEEYIKMLTKNSSINHLLLRFAAIYGEGERDSPILMKFAKMAGEKNQLNVTGNPYKKLDQLYVKDAVKAILCALNKPNISGTLNIGSGNASTLLQIAETINAVFDNDKNLKIENIEDAPLTTDSTMDINLAKEVLNWEPSFDLKSGIEDFKQCRYIDKR
ncbi:MAG: NAD(P)-dependent oxidoreductase [Spirochaetes bacterium]|jgi:UDP-glucose 4-epimerase|nr:NAD(P)-dependent oxidoreductase [Spirochaetota bacterium]